MWEAIEIEMKNRGYCFSALQIENKWNTLKRAFKKKTENNNKTGRARAMCPYEKELSECMLRKSSVIPEFLLGSNDNGKNRQELLIQLDSGQASSSSSPSPQMVENNSSNSETTLNTRRKN